MLGWSRCRSDKSLPQMWTVQQRKWRPTLPPLSQKAVLNPKWVHRHSLQTNSLAPTWYPIFSYLNPYITLIFILRNETRRRSLFSIQYSSFFSPPQYTLVFMIRIFWFTHRQGSNSQGRAKILPPHLPLTHFDINLRFPRTFAKGPPQGSPDSKLWQKFLTLVLTQWRFCTILPR